MKNEYICEMCGHYWHPCSSDKSTCGICGAGGKVKMNSKLDTRRKKRKKRKDEIIRTVDVSV